ncbi:MAG: nuclease [Halobacteriovorax sp.]|nr:nuclease [Halobacteriovorax sp.]|tara:strand:- start:51 stop:530 length:480 start_codon:yes stop_codon:yes gene_type:complete
MHKLLILSILFFSFHSYASDPCTHDEHSFRCVKYVKNYDADTVTFDIPNVHPLIGQRINVRINGVDTPELRTKNTCEKEKARNAKKLVSNLFKNAKRIDLSNIKRGKYFRIVADVTIDGKSLAHYLLKNGLATTYDGGTKKKVNWCKTSREIASENGEK